MDCYYCNKFISFSLLEKIEDGTCIFCNNRWYIHQIRYGLSANKISTPYETYHDIFSKLILSNEKFNKLYEIDNFLRIITKKCIKSYNRTIKFKDNIRRYICQQNNKLISKNISLLNLENKEYKNYLKELKDFVNNNVYYYGHLSNSEIKLLTSNNIETYPISYDDSLVRKYSIETLFNIYKEKHINKPIILERINSSFKIFNETPQYRNIVTFITHKMFKRPSNIYDHSGQFYSFLSSSELRKRTFDTIRIYEILFYSIRCILINIDSDKQTIFKKAKENENQQSIIYKLFSPSYNDIYKSYSIYRDILKNIKICK